MNHSRFWQLVRSVRSTFFWWCVAWRFQPCQVQEDGLQLTAGRRMEHIGPGSKTGLMSDVFWHSEPGVDFFGPKWRQTIWKLKIRQLRWAALKHSGCWVVLKLLHSLIFFILGIDRHPMIRSSMCTPVFFPQAADGICLRRSGFDFLWYLVGIPGILGTLDGQTGHVMPALRRQSNPARWDLLGRNVDSAARKWTRHLDWRLRFYKILHFGRPP